MDIIESRTAVKFTPGRQGARIDKIICHWWGVDGQSHDGVVDWFCNPARGAQTSAHFVVSAGRVHCIVSPTDTAWHAGDWNANITSIGIECRPEATAADYATVAELVKWLRTQYGDLPLRPHKAFTSTACPGRWDLARLDREARGGAAPVPAPSPSGAMRPAPAMYPVTQSYRQNATAYNSAGMHGAIDYGTPVGTPIVSPVNGTVIYDGWAWGLAGGPFDWHLRYYLIKPAVGDTKGGGGIVTLVQEDGTGEVWGVMHASQSYYYAGDRVRAGQVLQASGATGIVTGPHVHMNRWPKAPNWSNGAYGAIDPAPRITRPYAPITATSWQGSPTTGKGATTPIGDWFDMATKEELRAVVREEITNNLRHAKFRAHGDKKDTTLEGLLGWNLFRIREEQGVMKRLITGVRSAVDRLVPATDKEA